MSDVRRQSACEPARTKLFARLGRLGRNPWALAGGLLFVYVLAHPYLGFVHDARLYDLQVLNRVTGGRFDGDLFLAYGSQDSYSLFSWCMAPLARVMGVAPAFFTAYLLSVILLIYAEIRLVRQLIPERTVGNLALILLAVSGLAYGSECVFRTHEAFLTARLPAVGCSLLALALALERKWLGSLVFAVIAMAFHPLMAVGACAVVGGMLIFQRLSPNALNVLVVAVLAAVAGFLFSPLPEKFLTRMSLEWLETVRLRSRHCVLSGWTFMDWFRTAFGVSLLALRYPRATADQKRLLSLLLGAVAGGFLVNAVAEAGRYALLLQGQAYRVTWLLALVSVPVGLQVARDAWKEKTAVGSAIALVTFAGLGESLLLEYRAAVLLPVIVQFWAIFAVVVWLFQLSRTSDPAVRIRTALAIGLGLAFIVVSFRLAGAIAYTFRELETDPIKLAAEAIDGLSELCLFLPAVWLLARAGLSQRSARRAGLTLGAVGATLAAAAFTISDGAPYRSKFQRGFGSLPVVRKTISDRGGRPEQVYWTVEPQMIWNELGADSYFHLVQTAGVVFSPETAAEGRRRGELVKRFEIAHMRRLLPDPIRWDQPLRALEADFDAPPPTVDDLMRLAADEQLDWVVLYDEFPGLYTATDGRVYVYDCRELRRKQSATDVALAK